MNRVGTVLLIKLGQKYGNMIVMDSTGSACVDQISGRLMAKILDVQQPFVASVLIAEILGMCIKPLKICSTKISV